MKHRIVSILTALALCLSMCPAWALAAGVSPAYHSVYIGGTTVTDEASTTTIAAGKGTAVWDPASAVLTLENATFSDYISINAVDYSRTIKVILKGQNRIDISSSEENLAAALRTVCSLEIEAEDSAALEITTNLEQNYGQNAIIANHNLRIKSGTFNLRSGGQTIYGGLDAGTGVEIQGGNITAESPSAAIYSDRSIQIGEGAIVTAKSTGSNAVYSAGNVQIINSELDVSTTGGYPAIYGAALVDIQGGSITATCPNSNAIFSDDIVQITNSELNATGYYLAICGMVAVNIQGGSITAISTNSSAIYSGGSIQIQDAEVTARGGSGCAIYTPGTLNISGSTVTGHSDTNHVIYTTAPITIQNSELALTSDEYTSGIFLDANSPLTINGCTNVNVTTAGSAIVSNGDVSITDSRLTINSDDGNGIVAAVEEDNGGGTLSISGTTHIESQSAYPLTGYKVEMTGGYVKSVTSDGPAISATNGITVSGGEVYAESNGSEPTMKPAGLYSRKGEINLTGESTQVQAVSANYRAIYNEEGTISLNTNVIAKAGTDDPAFMACSVTNDASADPTHNITIGEGFSSEGSRPVTTKWKNETLITGYSHYAYTVLAPAGTENLQDDYLDTPSQITIAACLHPDNQCAYAHIAGTATHIRTCLDCGQTWYAEPCTYTFTGTTGACAACGDSLTVAVSGTENLIYDGTAKTPGVTVTRAGTELAVDTDYTVSYSDNRNAGTATVTVTIGTNQGTYTRSFTIGHATPTITWSSTTQELTYTGQQAVITAPAVTLVNGEGFGGTISYSHKKQGETAYKDGLPTAAGTYTVKAHVDAAGNYAAAGSTNELTLTINKADQSAPAAPTAADANIKDTSVTLNAIENAEYSMDGTTWQASPTFTGLNHNTAYTFYARLKEDASHNASPASAGTSITTKKMLLDGAAVTVSGTYTYTGTAIVPAAGDVTVTLNGVTIDAGQYTISVTGNVNAGTAAVTVTATADGNYSGSVSGSFVIGKAGLTITANAQTITYGGSIATGTDQVTPAGLAGGDTLESVTLAPSTSDVPGGSITPSGAKIQNESGADVTGNYEITYAPGDLTINKSQPAIAFAGGYDPSKTYDGQIIPDPASANLTITGAEFSDVTFTWSAVPKDAGTYTLTASIPATNNTEAAETTLTVTISPKTITSPTITLSPDTFVYDGAGKEPAVALKDGDTEIPASEYTVAYSDNINVGTATVTITDKDGGNYTVSGTAAFTITKADQAPLSITGAPGSATYGDTFRLSVSGGSGTGSVRWAASGAAVDNAGNVTVTKAGQVVITVVKDGDSNYYETEGRITLNAGKKALTVSSAAAQDRRYDGSNTVKITGVTLEGVVSGDTVSVSTENLYGALNGSNVGSYTAVTLPALTLTGEKADNYTLTRPAGAVSTSVTVSKAAPLTTKAGDLAVANEQEHTYTYGLGALRPDVPDGMSLGSSAVTYTLGTVSLGSYYGGSGARIEGQTLTLPIEAVESGAEGSIGTITVIIHTGNFEDMTATINVRSVNKTIPAGAPTLSADTLTYGQSLSAITLSGSMKDGETDVPGAFTWSSPDNRPAVQEAYAAAWTFTPADNRKYAIVNGTAAIQVLPAPIAGAVIALDPAAFRCDGAAHHPSIASVTLDGALLTADVDYTAQIPEGTDAGTYTVTLTGKGNYTGTASAAFTINPVETGDEFEDESGTVLRLEVETGLSTVPAALENDTRYDTPKKIETALRTQVEQVMSNVGENIAVFDVTLQYKDENGTWHAVDPDDFPAEGVTAILPYPDGTGMTGYTYTVQHLISSGDKAGEMETLTYELAADGLKCRFSSLSPVAIGYQAAAKPDPDPDGSSGGGSVSTHAVTIEKSEHGKVASNRTNASNGSTITLTVTPDSGYVLDTLTVTDSRGSEIKLTAQDDGKYIFTMPGRAVTVKAAFAPLPDGTACDGGEDCPSHGFTDLGAVGTWYHEAVDYVLRNNLMGGYGGGKFGPNDNLSRAQFAQILFNKEGRPVVNYLLQYGDVAAGAWYTEAVRWATSQGVAGGYGNGMFGPNDNITREQLAVMLWRYAGSPAATDRELHFSDTDEISGFALEAMRWAVENGIISGYGNGRLGPQGLATRAQVAQMLKLFLDDQK